MSGSEGAETKIATARVRMGSAIYVDAGTRCPKSLIPMVGAPGLEPGTR